MNDEPTLASELRDYAHRLTVVETWIETIKPIAEKRGTDVEELKLLGRESQTKQRLTFAVGSVLGSLLILLLSFIATRGG